MIPDSLLHAWRFPRDANLAAMVKIAQKELLPSDLRIRLLSSTGDTISALALDEVVPPLDDSLFYIQNHGAYEVVRRETWPGGREVLTLAAWPRR